MVDLIVVYSEVVNVLDEFFQDDYFEFDIDEFKDQFGIDYIMWFLNVLNEKFVGFGGVVFFFELGNIVVKLDIVDFVFFYDVVFDLMVVILIE